MDALNLNIQQLVESHLEANRTFDATKTALQQSDAAHILTKRNLHLTDLALIQRDREYQQISSALIQSKRKEIEQLKYQIEMRHKDIDTAGMTIAFLQDGLSDNAELMSGPYGSIRAATTDHDPTSELAQSIDESLSAGIDFGIESIRRWECEIEKSTTQIMALESQLAN
ncbi:hypothetical protein D6C83_03954 [Aureobasidium pullulans]|uniref:Uncharacterized protein n=1 Tax=Aureobasidium pullulans TaxID=5580 RepID=A0A4T0D8J0_AURPU|nr:hypothetical protein D6D22_03408 [Aureobasidium pullulans]TIA56779.1 hypothetical protein D6C83_03954 [Aureobasidium pullulans]